LPKKLLLFFILFAKPKPNMNRRDFIQKTSAAAASTVAVSTAAASFFIVPRRVLGKGYTAPSDLLSFGFIGCGKQSGGLRANFLKTGQVQFVAAADANIHKRTKWAEAANKFYAEKAGSQTYKSCEPMADFRELLNRKDIDAVIIASPDHWHAVMAVKACQAGKDVYCEKPLSLTVAEGRAMVRATRQHQRVLQTGSMQRSWKEFQQAANLVQSGAIGQIKQVKVNISGPPIAWDLPAEPTPEGVDWNAWLGPNTITRPYNNQLAPLDDSKFWPKWRNYNEFGGGGMTDWGAHMFDIAQWGLGMDNSGPVALTPPTDGTGKGLVYTYKNGVELIHQTVEGKQFCHFIGTEGEVWVARGELKTTPESLKTQVFDDSNRKVYFSDNHYEDFLKAIKTRKKPICDVEVGHRTASACNIGNIAYQLKRPLQWNPDTEQFLNDAEANALLTRPMRPEWNIL
jgi:predicted dehydrogenase